jgi:hypothetical protein
MLVVTVISAHAAAVLLLHVHSGSLMRLSLLLPGV